MYQQKQKNIVHFIAFYKKGNTT